MQGIMRRIEWLVDNAVVVVFGSMTIISFLQVFFRYVLNKPLFASEEIARLFAVWLTFLGSSLAIRHREHISVDILYVRVSSKVRRGFNLLSDLFLLMFHVFLVVEGTRLSYIFRGFESHALRFSMSFFFSALPITAFFILIFLFQCIREDIRELRSQRD
ncbi:MAG: TRAP transporter small permease subunit [candidate division Zixibacteria bacterium]|nr:TRAP transporter small permease subunit [candidate division Zixibacteria bacterium]